MGPKRYSNVAQHKHQGNFLETTAQLFSDQKPTEAEIGDFHHVGPDWQQLHDNLRNAFTPEQAGRAVLVRVHENTENDGNVAMFGDPLSKFVDPERLAGLTAYDGDDILAWNIK